MSIDPITTHDASMLDEFSCPEGYLRVGDRFPEFSVKAVKPGKEVLNASAEEAITEISSSDFTGKWLVVFAWPKVFTPVCKTEIIEFSRLNGEFQDRDAQVLGLSVDNEYAQAAWRKYGDFQNRNEDLQDIQFPILSDVGQEISLQCGILDPVAKVSQRATFIVDPDGFIRYVSVTSLNVGRNPKEVLRILDAEQTGGRCPCDWQKGDSTI